MTLKQILGLLLDAAETAFPSWAGLFRYLRPFVTAAYEDGLVVVGAAPASVTDAVVKYLNDLIGKTSRPAVKWGLRILVGLIPELIDLAWDSLFAGQPRPVMGATTRLSIDEIVKAADVA